MASNFNHQPLTICLTLLIFAIYSIEANSVCLISPYITSISSVEFSSRFANVSSKAYDKYKIKMSFQLDYKIDLTMRNLVVFVSIDQPHRKSEHNLIELEFSNERAPSASGKGEIVYYQDKFDSSDREALKFTKDDYLRLMRKFYDLHSLATTKKRASGIANTCSKIYQYAADFMIQFDKNRLHHFIIHNQIVCKASLANKVSALERLDGISYKKFEFKLMNEFSSPITAAKYQNKLLFLLSADGLLSIAFLNPNKTKLNEDIFPHSMRDLYQTYLYDRRLFEGKSDPHYQKTKCGPILRELKGSIQASVMVDILTSKPFITLSRLNENVYVAVNQTGKNELVNLVRDNQSFLWSHSIKLREPLQAAPNASIKIEAIAIKKIDTNSNEASIVFYDSANNFTHFVTTKIDDDLKVLNSTTDKERKQAGYVVPDDITYWAACDKLVSVYGFFYTLHDHGQDILNDESYWFKFDENLFEHQIEAVHADGDKFKFILKTTTMIMLTADSSNCDELIFVGRAERGHLRHLFEQEIGPSQLLYEGRYFDGHDWIPAWDDLNIYTTAEGTGLGGYIYIIGGVVVSLIIIIMLILLRRFAFKQPSRHIIYSKTPKSSINGSWQVRKSRSPSSKTESPHNPSLLPLFSEHASSPRKSATSPRRKKHKTKTKSKSASPKQHLSSGAR